MWLPGLHAIMPRVQLPLEHLQPSPFQVPSVLTTCTPASCRCLLLIAPTELPLHQGPRESTFFIGHTTSFQTHPFLAPAFDGLCIPDKSFGGAGFRMSPNTINYSWESKKQKSDSPSGKWSWRHLHIHYLKFLILARVK